MSKEAMKLALEALEGSTDKTLSIRAMEALQEALAEQPAQQPAPVQQEPVALEGQRKLVEILAENWRVWPARKAVEQTSLGDVFCSAKGRDLMFGNHEIASDQESAVVTKEMWSTMREALAEQPTTTKNNGGKTGWPPGLLQDDCKGLSKWLSNRPDAKRRVREALAEQPAQPVPSGWQKIECPICGDMAIATDIPAAQRTWVGLTDEERQEIWKGCDPAHAGYVTALVEAKLKEKNTP